MMGTALLPRLPAVAARDDEQMATLQSPAAQQDRPRIDVAELIEHAPVGRAQWGIAILCAVLLSICGLDIQTIALSVPMMAAAWNVPAVAFTPVFVAGLCGLVAGTLAVGPIADRMGRRWPTIVSALMVAVFALASTHAHSVAELIWLRFATDVAAGALMPNAMALTAECMPRRHLQTAVSLVFAGFPAGGLIAGLLGAWVIPAYGWAASFHLLAAAALVLMVVSFFALPESIRFLAARRRRPAELMRLLEKLCGRTAFNDGDDFTISEHRLTGLTVRHLFTEGRALTTVLVWLTFICNLMMLYFFMSWLPTVLGNASVPPIAVMLLSSLFFLGGIVGNLALTPVVGRFGAPLVLAATYGAGGLCIAGIGLAGASLIALAVLVFLSGWGLITTQNVLNAVAAAIYPTPIRVTGVGWALGVGRTGSILGPIVGAFLMSMSLTRSELFLAAALPAVAAAALSLFIGRAR